MVNKMQPQQQKTEGYSIANEEFGDDLILRSWHGIEDQVRRVNEFNKSQGIKNVDQFIGYNYDGIQLPMSVKQKVRFLNIIRHRKSGAWITVDSLVASGKISEIEKEAFGTGKFPRIELLSLTRVLAQDGSQYLLRNMRARGLSDIGAELTLPLPDCDFTRKVPISPDTTTLPDGNTTVKILRVGSGEFTYEASPKIYITPFNKENVLSAIQKYPPAEDSEQQGRIIYMISKEGQANEIAVSNLEEFLTDDPNSTFESKRMPAPQIHLDSKDLLNYAKHDRESREKSHQYG